MFIRFDRIHEGDRQTDGRTPRDVDMLRNIGSLVFEFCTKFGKVSYIPRE